MRITCVNCSATFLVDDGLLGREAVGVQCPFCSHVEVVRGPSSGPDALDLGFGGRTGSDGLGLGPESSSGGRSLDLGLGSSLDLRGGPSSSLDLDREAGPSSSLDLDRRGAPSPGLDLDQRFGSGSSLDLERRFGPSSSLDLERRFGSGPSVDLDQRFGAGRSLDLEPSSSSRSAAQRLGFGADVPRSSGDLAFQVGPPSGDVGGVQCQECGTPLIDEFDKVIGLCEVHQRERVGPSGRDGAPMAPSGAWFARTPDTGLIGPLPLEALRDRIRSGEIPLSAQFSEDGARFFPLASFKELAYLASLGGRTGLLGARASYAATRTRFDPSRIVTPALALGVLLGLAVLAYLQREDLARIYRGIVTDEPVDGPRRANPLRRYLATWRRDHPDVSGSSREHLRAAHDLHLEDTWDAYEKAERAYQRALLLDESDAEAIAGFVENLALWRYWAASPEELEVARAALEYAFELRTEPGPIHRAAGALAWVSGDLNGCRSGADAALARARTDARARLILAGCYVEGNVPLAIREAELARGTSPRLRRADRVLAEAYRRGGRFKSAYRLLDQRLSDDPRNGAVHLLYGDVEGALGRYAEAEGRYRKAGALEGDRAAAFIALGSLALEMRDPAKAAEAFERAAQLTPPTGARGALLYAEWARAEMLRGRARRAHQLADLALELQPRHVPALLVRADSALAARTTTVAAEIVRRALKEREDEPASLVLAARIDHALGDVEGALGKLRAAARNDPKDARLQAVLAGQYLAAGRPPQAYASMRKAVELDPELAAAVGRNGPLSIGDAPLREAVARFERSARTPRDASVAHASIALVRHHLGEGAAARRSARTALDLDDGNVLALVYSAHFALEDGDPAAAHRLAERMLVVERGSALGFLYRARSAIRKKAFDRAREDLRAALRSNPGLLTAEIELAALDLVEGGEGVPGAREVLDRAFTVAPDLLSLRRLLHQHEP